MPRPAQTSGRPDRTGPWNDTVTPYPRDHCLHELFEERARAAPRAPAVRHGDRTLTYGELSRCSDALARRLLTAGVRPGSTVGVLGGRCPEALVAFLAALKCGAVYVPLDDAYPPARLRAMAEEADVRVAVALPGSTSRVRGLRACIEGDLTAPAPGAGACDPTGPPAPRAAAPEDCAYIMFTSGSTGRPKPVAIPHRGVVRLASSGPWLSPPAPGERVLHAYSCSSDASTIEIWTALLSGACLVVAEREQLLSVDALERLLREEGVAVAFLTAGVLHHVARNRPEALRGLRFVSAGGEALDARLCRRVLAACPGITLVNFYGPTENSVVSSAYVVRDLPADAATVPIGRPFPNSTCHVLRADGTPAGPGEEGDLLVGGDGIALGYLNDPVLTAERFLDDPFGPRPGGRLYRTGDRARWRPDGVLEYRGRHDRQVKLRGFRVELDEIETRLRSHEAVGEAVVELDGEGARARPVAFVTPARPGGAVAVGQVRAYVASWLPAPAVPARIHVLDRFPVTGAGKVDRRALVARTMAPGGRDDSRPDTAVRAGSGRTGTGPYAGGSAGQTDATGNGDANANGQRPASAAGSEAGGGATGDGSGLLGVLADVWEHILRVRPAPADSFFDLGGDSLLIAEATTRTMTALGMDAAHGTSLVRGLLREPTLGAYAAAVDRALRADRAGRRTGSAPAAEADFLREARLGLRPPPVRGPVPRWRDPARVLVTGATGFVGAFLLDRLAHATGAELLCPVRARDAAHARRRVCSNAARYGLDTAPYRQRLTCFPADLAAPRLGLSEERFTRLGGTADLILHAGARVNFLYPYAALRPANVDGTRELVRLAAGRRIPLHFLSTIAVLAGFGTAGVRQVAEDAPLAHADRLTMGYAESKWVAERLLKEAARAGLPVTVHRPYEVTGEQRTGICNTETAISSLFRVIAETGVAPDVPLPLDFVPVDHLAAAVVHLATHEPADGRTYHLTNPRPARLADMLTRMRAAGYRIRELPYDAWVAELVQHVARHPSSPTTPFVSLCVDRSNKSDMSVKEMYLDGVFPRLGRANTERGLADSGLVCPPTDAALLDRYLTFFRSSGFLPPPLPHHDT
ncbi:amino acid adenylation domain-containing protein [Streptomyces albofaciens JCM 4342]|uniref:amino acid adenylation domain-containing protein n=1 Tax=Streptomyces albofaciens TaxID=66866 RepID=UPI001238A1B4|nr:amino acid adenylation domain-containing protein [Streptomyces albofaciens]KAA6212543.1 amino acid adenylation domain-containing protein [Streptomyces albofaciens JCM 4342]